MKDTPIHIRAESEFKRRLHLAAKSRNMKVSAYVRDRMEDHIRADLTRVADMVDPRIERLQAA